MIGFCTSLRARAMADDWPYHVWLLERVVHSMLSQSEGEPFVAIGCHDIPDSPLASDPRVQFVPLNIELPQRTFDDMSCDKVLKVSAAVRVAQSRGCEYIVFNDADDLISGRIGSHAMRYRGANGWYTRSERRYAYGGRLMRFHEIADPWSGPCVVVRSDLLSFAAPPFAGPWADRVARGDEQEYLDLLQRHGREVCTLSAVGHGHYRSYMADNGTPLAPLPFPGNVVINHKDSMSTAGGRHGYPLLSTLAALRRSVQWLPTLRVATATIRREFQIPPNQEIPAAYRSAGSVFWR
jgi:hypothetical protein